MNKITNIKTEHLHLWIRYAGCRRKDELIIPREISSFFRFFLLQLRNIQKEYIREKIWMKLYLSKAQRQTQRNLAVIIIRPGLFLIIVNCQLQLVNCIFRGVIHASAEVAATKHENKNNMPIPPE